MRKIQFNQNLPEASEPASFNASEHNPNKTPSTEENPDPKKLGHPLLTDLLFLSPHTCTALPRHREKQP